MKRARRTAILAVLAAACITVAGATGLATHTSLATAAGPCQLGNKDGQIKHVIYLQFDNTHYARDVAGVPSDLEQMPNLLDFLTGNGTLVANDHTVLISHTAGGIVSSLTGLYPDRNGQTVSNSYFYYGANNVPAFSTSFKYWTDTVDGSDDSLPNMVGDGGQTAPAPWLTYTHAGCNVGGVSAANIELENTGTDAAGDMTRVFGGPTNPADNTTASPEWQEAKSNSSLAQTDFVGIAIHCALGNTLCDSTHARPDDATTVPGSDDGYKALFGAKYVNPAITHPANGCVKATDGGDITDSAHRCGFPGFDGALAKNTLGEVAQMQENGVPVTFAYISDAHDNHALARASGPGEADYKQQLADYNTAFGAFFDRLQRDGITKANTLFVVTVDEGDHFAGGTGTINGTNRAYTHAGCPDLNACPPNQIGEVTTNLKALLPSGEPTFSLHNDDAPAIYVNGAPTRTDPAVRKLERDAGGLTYTDPYAQGGAATVRLTQRLADSVEESALHMVNSDPKRTPTFTLFGNPDFFFQGSDPVYPAASTGQPNQCAGVHVCVSPAFAWNHGDVQDEIGTTWLGMVGPGVERNGVDMTTWTDHVDLRPTINQLLGLQDSYVDDGRVIAQIVDKKALSKTLHEHHKTTEQLGEAYKQIDAPFGQFAHDTLIASTNALERPNTTEGNLAYDGIEAAIADLTSQRDVLAGEIRQALNDAAAVDKHDADKIDEKQAKEWITRAQSLLDRAHQLAVDNPAPA